MAFYDKALALDIGSRAIKGVSFKHTLGELQLLDCQFRFFSDFDIPVEIIHNAPDRDLFYPDYEEPKQRSTKKAKKPAKKETVPPTDSDEPDEQSEEEALAEAALAEAGVEAELDETVLLEEEVVHPTILSYIIRDFVSEFWSLEYTFIINLASDALIIRDIKVPFHEPKKILDILPFELENVVSLNIEDTTVETSVWGINEEGGATSLTMCVPNERISERVNFFLDEHLILKNISAEPVTLSRLVTDSAEAQYSDFCAQLDIGGSYSVFNIIHSNELVFTRVLNIGGDDFTAIIAEILNTSEDQAEEIKLRMDLDLADLSANDNTPVYKQYKIKKTDIKKIVTAMSELVSDLADEIVLSLTASGFKDTLRGIYVSGGGSRIHGLRQLLADNLTFDGEPPEVIDYEHISKFPEPSGLDMYAGCVGQIYHLVHTKKRPVDFLKGSIRNLLKGQKDFAVLKAPMISIALSIVMALSSYFIGLNSLNTQIEDAEAQVKKVFSDGFGKWQDSYGDPLLKAKSMLSKQAPKTPVNLNDEDKILNILKIITQSMPDLTTDFTYKRIRVKDGDITLEGFVPDFSSVTKVKETLEQSKAFSKVETKNKKTVKNKGVSVKYILKVAAGALKAG